MDDPLGQGLEVEAGLVGQLGVELGLLVGRQVGAHPGRAFAAPLGAAEWPGAARRTSRPGAGRPSSRRCARSGRRPAPSRSGRRAATPGWPACRQGAHGIRCRGSAMGAGTGRPWRARWAIGVQVEGQLGAGHRLEQREHVAAQAGGDEEVAVLHAGGDALRQLEPPDGVVAQPGGEIGLGDGSEHGHDGRSLHHGGRAGACTGAPGRPVGIHWGFPSDRTRFVTHRSALPEAAALFDHMADTVYLIDRHLRHAWGNRAAWAMLGLSREDVLDHSVLSLQMDVTGMPSRREIAGVIRAGRLHLRRPPPPRRWARVHVEVEHHPFQPRRARVFPVGGPRRAAAAGPRGRTCGAARASCGSPSTRPPTACGSWEIATGQLFFSPQMKRMLGYSPDEMAGVLATWSDALHPDDRDRVMGILQEHLDGNAGAARRSTVCATATAATCRVHPRGRVCSAMAGARRPARSACCRTSPSARSSSSASSALASSDALAGLPNRRQGERFLEAELELCRRLGLRWGCASSTWIAQAA